MTRTAARQAFALAPLMILLSALAGTSRADSMVAPGWTLMATRPGTTFFGVPFEGVSLGTFDFGGSIGVRDVGDTSLIFRRLTAATGPEDTIPVELVVGQLRSVEPVDLGCGLGVYYITMSQSMVSPSSMTIRFGSEDVPHGTFDTTLNAFLDVRLGAPDGMPCAPLSGEETLTATDVAWAHIPFPVPPPWRMLGVDYLLNGVDTDQDFWPYVESYSQVGTDPGMVQVLGQYICFLEPIPEPSSVVLGGLGGLGLLMRRAFRRRA